LQIDLFTFVAQIVNFLILVALLRHFLYKRIVKAMDERKRNIAARMDEAEEKQKEAEDKADAYERKQKELQEEKKKTLFQAEKDADAKRRELMDKARQEVKQNQKKWREGLLRQRESFADDIRRRAGEQVCHVSHRVLKELADKGLEEQVVQTFLKRWKDLSSDEKKDLLEGIPESNELVLKSAFDLPKKLRADVEKALERKGGKSPALEYRRDENLVCGIELNAGGKKVAWSIESYLESLEESLSGAFDRFRSEKPKEEKPKNDNTEGKKEKSRKSNSKKEKPEKERKSGRKSGGAEEDED